MGELLGAIEELDSVEESGSLAFDIDASSDHRESCKSVTLEGSEDALLVLLEDGVELDKTVLEIADDSSCVTEESPQADMQKNIRTVSKKQQIFFKFNSPIYIISVKIFHINFITDKVSKQRQNLTK